MDRSFSKALGRDRINIESKAHIGELFDTRQQPWTVEWGNKDPRERHIFSSGVTR